MVNKIILALSAFWAILFSILKPLKTFGDIWFTLVIFVLTYAVQVGLYFFIVWLISLTIKKKEYDNFNKFYNFIFNITEELVFDLARVTIETKGIEKMPHNEKYLLVYNHKSKFDPMTQSVVLKKDHLIHISKPENFKIPLAGNFALRNRYLPIDRNNARHALITINKAAEMIEKGEASVGISPEGTRNTKDGLLPFRAGSFKIALKSHCPIVVCTMRNCEKVHKNFPLQRTTIQMHVVEVIPYEKYKEMTTIEISKMVRKLMLDDLGIKEDKNNDELHII